MEIAVFILLLVVLTQIGGGFVYEGVHLARTGHSDRGRGNDRVWLILTPAQAVARHVPSRWVRTVCFAVGAMMLLVVALAIISSLVR
jgi:hypothetical protein